MLLFSIFGAQRVTIHVGCISKICVAKLSIDLVTNIVPISQLIVDDWVTFIIGIQVVQLFPLQIFGIRVGQFSTVYITRIFTFFVAYFGGISFAQSVGVLV